MIRTANPALNAKSFISDRPVEMGMTIMGTVGKTAVLLVLTFAAAMWSWRSYAGQSAAVAPLMLVGVFGGFGVAILTVFKKAWSPVTGPIYAILEGLFLGVISAAFNAQYPGIVIQAVLCTFGTLAALLVAYTSRLIKPTENFKLGVVAATGGIFLVYLVSMVMNLFGASMPLIHSNGPLGIGFSVFIVIIAALNLVLDFDFIETAAETGAPKYMEWYAAFGLMVTLIWLYLEILRLLAKLNSRR